MQRAIFALESMTTSRWCGGEAAGHMLRDHDLLSRGIPEGGCCWSGTLADEDEPPLVWLARGWDRFRELLAGGGACCECAVRLVGNQTVATHAPAQPRSAL